MPPKTTAERLTDAKAKQAQLNQVLKEAQEEADCKEQERTEQEAQKQKEEEAEAQAKAEKAAREEHMLEEARW